MWTGSAHDGTELMVNGVSHALGQPQAGYGTPGSNTPGVGPLQSGSTADSTVKQAIYGLTSVYRVVHPGLVSNLGQSGRSTDDRSARRSQRFTTGANLHGYELSGVLVGYVFDRQGLPDFSISVHAVDTDGHPGTKVADFTYPEGDNERSLTFEAPDGVTLDPGTTYAVVVTSGTTGTDIKLRATTSNREDSESEDGWSIEDAFDIESGSSWAADTDGRSLKIRVRGTPKVGPPAKPTGLSANAMGRERINLSWTAPSMDGGSAVTGYRVESSADGSHGLDRPRNRHRVHDNLLFTHRSPRRTPHSTTVSPPSTWRARPTPLTPPMPPPTTIRRLRSASEPPPTRLPRGARPR